MKSKILFVCVENSCRSQLSEALARKLGGEVLEPYSAGSKPSGKINESAIAVLKEKGIDTSSQKSKGLDDLPQWEWDTLITMGCGDACPHLPAKNRLDWDLADPKGKPIEAFRKTRDDIEALLTPLINKLKNHRCPVKNEINGL